MPASPAAAGPAPRRCAAGRRPPRALRARTDSTTSGLALARKASLAELAAGLVELLGRRRPGRAPAGPARRRRRRRWTGPARPRRRRRGPAVAVAVKPLGRLDQPQQPADLLLVAAGRTPRPANRAGIRWAGLTPCALEELPDQHHPGLQLEDVVLGRLVLPGLLAPRPGGDHDRLAAGQRRPQRLGDERAPAGAATAAGRRAPRRAPAGSTARGALGSASDTLASSRYQSHTSSQAKW